MPPDFLISAVSVQPFPLVTSASEQPLLLVNFILKNQELKQQLTTPAIWKIFPPTPPLMALKNMDSISPPPAISLAVPALPPTIMESISPRLLVGITTTISMLNLELIWMPPVIGPTLPVRD